MILLVINAAMPSSIRSALGPAALIVGGGLLQMLFAIVAWPLQRYRPERECLADVPPARRQRTRERGLEQRLR